MSVATARESKRVGVWERIQFQEDPSPTAARALLKLQFSQKDKSRMNELSAKARAGSLTPDEEAEILQYEQIGCMLDILHSKARRVLKRQSI